MSLKTIDNFYLEGANLTIMLYIAFPFEYFLCVGFLVWDYLILRLKVILFSNCFIF